MINNIILAIIAVLCIEIAGLTGKYTKDITIITVSLVLIYGVSWNVQFVRILCIIIVSSTLSILKTMFIGKR